MAVEDLVFNDRDARRVLKLTVARQKEKLGEERDRLEQRAQALARTDTSCDSAVTYHGLVELARSRGLDPQLIPQVIESEEYKQRLTLYQLARENANAFGISVLGTAIAGLGIVALVGNPARLVPGEDAIAEVGRYVLTNPLLYAVTATAITDMIKVLKGQPFVQALRDDVGEYVGTAATWAAVLYLV